MSDNDWETVELSEIVNIKTGRLDSNAAVENGKYPFFTCSPETFRINDYAFDAEAILLAGNNANGVFPIKHYSGKFNAYQRTYVITAKNPSTLYLKYLFYQLSTQLSLLQEFSIGSATKFLTMRILNPVKIPLPPLTEQRAIAEVLSALDDKIELNRRMNATLEALTKAIFKSWFVDFDPVHAKSNGRQPEEMDPETAKLFPPAFEGDMPLGWQIVQFGSFLTSLSERIGTEDAPEYSATVNGLILRDKTFNKTLSKSKEKNKKIIKNNLVFGLSRQTINFGVMKEDIGSVSPVYEIFNINTNVYIPELLELYMRLRMDEYIDILKPAAREGQAIDKNYLLTKKIFVPDMKVQMRYQELCLALNEKFAHNEKESQTLMNLRDNLLSKLMRGEVRVKV